MRTTYAIREYLFDVYEVSFMHKDTDPLKENVQCGLFTQPKWL